MTDNNSLTRFYLQLFPQQQISVDAIASFADTGDQWQHYLRINLPGFDGSQSVDLSEFWNTVFSQQPNHHQCDVVGRETIVKWADTKQLTQHFTLVADLTYEQVQQEDIQEQTKPESN